MLISYKVEIKPTKEQKMKINRTIGICRFVYNLYIARNKEVYIQNKGFLSGMDFSKWMNNKYLKENPDKMWIKTVSSKSIKQSIMNAERAFKNFFKKQSTYPSFKKKGKSDVKMYFVKNDAKHIIKCERHRIKVPTLGFVRLKEKGYIPTSSQNYTIKSGTISYKAGRYYISVLVEQQELVKPKLNNFGLGIDLGIKNLAIISNKMIYKNINKTSRIKNLEKRLKRHQRSFSRKWESYKNRLQDNDKKIISKQNIYKEKLKIQKLYQRLNLIRTDYINKMINQLVKIKPAYITIEDLNISGMMKNKYLSKAIAKQKFYEIRTKLISKCRQMGIEVRIVDKFYASSKTCHQCGKVKSKLNLSDRIFTCECGYTMDRDLNASLNLRDAKTYKLAW